MLIFCVIYLIVNILSDISAAMRSRGFYCPTTLNMGGTICSLEHPIVMGVINVNDDSFYSGSALNDRQAIIERTAKMIEEGATIIDLGAMSTRPGAKAISEREEIKRFSLGLESIRKEFPDFPISIDTSSVSVLESIKCFKIHMVNDISGGNEEMYLWVAEHALPYVLMHMKGTPETMKLMTEYDDIIKEMLHYFIFRIDRCIKAGVKDIILDPGLGFAKTIDQNYYLLNHLHVLQMLELPILIGLSRKSMIWKTLDISPDEALNGTTALHMQALMKGARILRAHDVKEAIQTIKLYHKLQTNI